MFYFFQFEVPFTTNALLRLAHIREGKTSCTRHTGSNRPPLPKLRDLNRNKFFRLSCWSFHSEQPAVVYVGAPFSSFPSAICAGETSEDLSLHLNNVVKSKHSAQFTVPFISECVSKHHILASGFFENKTKTV